MLGAALALIVSVVGCTPSFRNFKQITPSEEGFLQHRVNANGNAVIESPLVLDTLLWERKLNAGIAGQVVGNAQYLVVPTYNRRLYFLNPRTGKEITSLVTESAIGSAVVLRNELIYFADEAGGDLVTCFNVVNGKKSWSLKVKDPQGAPLVDGDELFVASRDGKVYCVNRWTGVLTWSYESHRQIYAAVAADKEHVVFGTDRGELMALSRATGKLEWSFQAGGSIFAQPLLQPDLVFCGASDGIMYAVTSSSGKESWRFETTAAIHTTPVRVGDRMLFGGDDRYVYCLSADNGGKLWSYRTNAIVQSSPIAVGKSFIIANSAGSVLEFSLDGAVTKEFSIRGSVEAPAAFVDDRIYVVTPQRRLYCFGPK